jgi:hypothetical protein
VSADLIELIRNGTPPGHPQRPLVRRGRIAWEFPVNGARPELNQAVEGFPR